MSDKTFLETLLDATEPLSVESDHDLSTDVQDLLPERPAANKPTSDGESDWVDTLNALAADKVDAPPRTKEWFMEVFIEHDDDQFQEKLPEYTELYLKAVSLTGAEYDTIRQLYDNGPRESGEVPSKSARDVLVGFGAVTPIVKKKEQGYYALTYKGSALLRIVNALGN